MNAIQDNEFSQTWKSLGKKLPRPKRILSISAHWETDGCQITGNAKPPTIHDFGGFPKELYQVEYPSPGDPEFAFEISKEYPQITISETWGLDHGTWSVLLHLFPEANIPVLQLSLPYEWDFSEHYAFAKTLSQLREAGTLLLGTGNLVHNLRLAAWNRLDDPYFSFPWAETAMERFQSFIQSSAPEENIEALFQEEAIRLAVPTREHFLPALYILALRQPEESVFLFQNTPFLGSLHMASFLISEPGQKFI